jgi:hypothetical protein
VPVLGPNEERAVVKRVTVQLRHQVRIEGRQFAHDRRVVCRPLERNVVALPWKAVGKGPQSQKNVRKREQKERKKKLFSSWGNFRFDSNWNIRGELLCA